MVRSLVIPGVAQHRNPVPNAAIHRGMLCTSGILGKDPATDLYPPDIGTQAGLCFRFLDDILAVAGATHQDVLKVDLYFRDKADRSVVNRFWLERWPDPMLRPARQAHVSELPEGCRLQVSALAIMPSEAGPRD